MDYARGVCDALCDAGVRAVLDERDEKIGYKIRDARMTDRVPYMLILGEKESAEGTIAVRDRSNETKTMGLDEFVAAIGEEIATRDDLQARLGMTSATPQQGE